MKRLWVGMLLASLPVVLLAQPQNQRPSRDGWFNPTTPPDNSVTARPLPPPDNAPFVQRPSRDGWFNPPTPSDNAVTARPPPPDNSVVVAPPPPADNTTADPPDNSVTSTPLPPPSNPTDQSQDEMVPNPLDTPNAPGSQGDNRQTQQKGQIVRGGWVQMGTATLQALDKVNAIQKMLVVKVGDTGHFDSLNIAVRGCFVRASDVPADATAYLVIRDERADAPSFTGWMIRSAPYMSMLAHPIYDVRVAGCTP